MGREAEAVDPLERLGRYVLLAPLAGPRAHGLAFDSRLERTVRVFRLQTDGDPDALGRAVARARAWSRIADPHLVAVHDSVELDERWYVIVEHVRMTPWPQWIAAGRRDRTTVRRGAAALVRALARVHATGLCHGAIEETAVGVDGAGNARLGGFLPHAPDAGPETCDADARALLEVLALPGVRAGDLSRLAAGLERDPARVRRRALGLALAGAAVATVAILHRPEAPATGPTCTGADALVAQVWSPARREAVAGAFAATGAPLAVRVGERVAAGFDARTVAWAQAWVGACVPGADRRRQCLEERRAELDALAAVFEHADAATVTGALSTMDELTPLRACEGGELASEPEASPAIAGEVDGLRRRMAAARALLIAERFEGLADATAMREQAEALGHPPLLAEATLLEARFLLVGGEPAAAQPVLERAVRAAWRAGHDRVAVDAWTQLEELVGATLARREEAEEIWGHALAAWERAGGLEGQRAELLATRGVVLFTRGEYDASAALHREAYELRRDVLGAGDPSAFGSLNDLANAQSAAGRLDEALATYAEVLAGWTQARGPGHPDVADVHNNIGAAWFMKGEHAAARAAFERSLEIRTAAFGPEHLLVAEALENVGVVASQSGELELAMAHFDRALRVKQALLPADAPGLAGLWLNIGTVLDARGEHAEARESFEHALRIWRPNLGPDHPHVAVALHDIGRSLRLSGRPAEALAPLEEALAIRERALDPDHPAIVSTLVQLGLSAAALDRREAALGWLERAAPRWREDDREIQDAARTLKRLRAGTGRGG
jgi:tetratricopeptide (TPR) repeat protein